MVSKEYVEELFTAEGEMKGSILKTDAMYLRSQKGDEGLEKVQKKLQEWGHPVEYDKLHDTELIPLGLRFLSILAAKEVFGWDDREVFQWGYAAPAYSFLVKLVMRFFVTLERIAGVAEEHWLIFYTVGELTRTEYDDEKQLLIMELQNFPAPAFICPYYAGYILKIGQLSTGKKQVRLAEVMCDAEQQRFVFTYRWGKRIHGIHDTNPYIANEESSV